METKTRDPNTTWINEGSGEIKTNISRLITNKEDEQIHRHQQRTNSFNHIGDVYGEFFFYKYDDFLEYLNYDLATAFRFLYICSFADADNKIILPNKRFAQTEKDFVFVFNKPRKSVEGFHKSLVDNELIYKDFNSIYRVNDNYFSKKIINDNDFKQHSTRVFDKAIQDLYNMLTSDEHVFAGELLKLIPYMNIYSNILCHNISERDPAKVDPLTKKELQDVFRPNSDYGRKLRTKIETFSINDEPVIGKVSLMDEYQYFINPRLFYRGNNINDLKAIINHIDISIEQAKKKKGVNYNARN